MKYQDGSMTITKGIGVVRYVFLAKIYVRRRTSVRVSCWSGPDL